MKNVQNNKKVKVAPDGTRDMLAPDQFLEMMATVILGFMENFKNAANNVDPVAGYASLLDELSTSRVLDKGIIEGGGICPDCGSQMNYIGQFSVQLFSTAIFLLVKQRMITPKSITLPSLEMITQGLENGYLQMMEMECQECEAKIVTTPMTDLEFSWGPKASNRMQ